MPLPVETLADLLVLLNRDELEAAQLVHSKFALASEKNFASGDVPLRKIEHVTVTIVEHKWLDRPATLLHIVAQRSPTDEEVTKTDFWWEAVAWLSDLMRFSAVETFLLVGSDKIGMSGITSAMWDGFMDAFRGVAIDTLYFRHIDFCPLTAADIERLTTLTLRKELYVFGCRLLSNHVTDQFLQKLSRKGLSEVSFRGSVPADKALFEASDDGVLALCFPDEHPRVDVELTLENVGLTDAFFGQFLQECQAVPEDRRVVKCLVQPLPSDTERHIMALDPIRHDLANGNIAFFFDETECGFRMGLSSVRKNLYCQYN